MDETHYSISEAGKLVGVESHVLRYWEDELQFEIPRNPKGHRYYTELHIRLFRKIRELKDKGYQLKAIEQVLSKMIAGDEDVDPDQILEQQAVDIILDEKEEGGNGAADMNKEAALKIVQKKELSEADKQGKVEQFQQLMNQIITGAIGQAVRQNNEALSEEISRQVNDRMVQEMEYMMRVNDERAEERFKMLDETLRTYQKEGKGKAEAAVARLPFFKKKKFGRSGKKL